MATLIKTLALFMLLLAVSLAQQQELYKVEKCLLTVYRDGVVHIHLEASVNELEPYIMLPLPSSPEKISKIENILILDEDREVLDYDYGENNTIIIYTLGARKIDLKCDTLSLTSMEYGLWTLKIRAPYNVTIRFPEGAAIIYINALPLGIRPINKQIEITLSQGDWEISYEVPVTPPTAPPENYPPVILDNLKNYLIYLIICAACASIIAATLIKRRRTLKGLSDEEIEVVRFIREKGGKVLEAELRERFPQIPRTSMWRLIRRLEKKGVIKVKKIGLQNVVELK